MKRNKEIAEKVGVIYAWLDDERNQSRASGICGLCGKCCDFESFGHKLFITSPEMIYFAHKLTCPDVIASGASGAIGASAAKQSQRTTARCPYQLDHKCTVYPYRFAACRIFSCKGDSAFQSDLTEAVVKKFKAVCAELQIPYRYVELPAALKSVVTAEHAENAEGDVK